jgi:hypothetical protein
VRLSPGVRKLNLTAHVTASVGWLGGVIGAFALALVGLTSGDVETVKAAYIALELIAWLVLVPLAFASLVTGLIQSLGTAWGLFRHYWVVFKLLVNVVATVVLLLYTRTLSHLADTAAETTPSASGVSGLREPSPALHAGAALLLLVLATALAVYKPHGLTPYGLRKERERQARAELRPPVIDGERRR